MCRLMVVLVLDQASKANLVGLFEDKTYAQSMKSAWSSFQRIINLCGVSAESMLNASRCASVHKACMLKQANAIYGHWINFT
jgi:hypothetical protein